MKIVISEALPRHVEDVSAIWEAGWHEAHDALVPDALRAVRTRESFLARSAAHQGATRVALADGRVVGFCMVHEDELYQMYVSPAARGTGAAQALMRDAEARIRSAGHGRAWLACAIGNATAERFYEKSGWINVRTEVVDVEVPDGTFPLQVWCFEKALV